MRSVTEPSRKIPVIDETDLLVLGGSCTGVFAAVRAARMGLKVVIVEKLNCFGGTATAGQVCVYHSVMDVDYGEQVIGGLSCELIDRLLKRGAAELLHNSASMGSRFNAEEMKIELDALVLENGVKPRLHTSFCAPYFEDGKLRGAFVEDKDGRGVILAKFFIDATGDGDLLSRLGVASYVFTPLQPPTTCAKVQRFGALRGIRWHELVEAHGAEFGLPPDWGWNTVIPGLDDITMMAETHAFNVNGCVAADLTRAEMDGRRSTRALLDLLAKYAPPEARPLLVALPSIIGLRDTRHFRSRYRVMEKELLSGVRFGDAIANGSYRVDVHHGDSAGITFRYLTGEEEVITSRVKGKSGRWLPEGEPHARFYQIPYRSLLPVTDQDNVLCAGRMIDADEGAFGAVRVMINLNQCGEAAGVAAALAVQKGVSADSVDAKLLRDALMDGGSIVR